MIDFAASLPHFADHLAPVWRRLGGKFYTRTRDHVASLGIPPSGGRIPPGDRPVVVASSMDMRWARDAGRPVIFMEHGAGQSYITPHDRGSYIGSTQRDGVVLACVPNERAAEKQLAATPDLNVAVTGCPRLDDLLAIPRPSTDTIAITHHWNCQLVPETTWGWLHFRPAYPALAKTHSVIGHAHPRAFDAIQKSLAKYGLPAVRRFTDVVERADVLVCDNSSVMFEWAALDRPVVVLNPPQYRRDVHHGGRFWEWADVGVNCDHHSDLAAAVDLALSDPPEVAARRAEVAREVYAYIGSATDRVVAEIRSVVQ